MKCYGCGVEKDLTVMEEYSHPETDRICDGPIEPLFVLECSPVSDGDAYKVVAVCHECFHRLDPDMWISDQCWRSIDPKVEFKNLPEPLLEDREIAGKVVNVIVADASRYPDILSQTVRTS